MDFAIVEEERVAMKESEKINKCVDLVKELNKLKNLNVTVIKKTLLKPMEQYPRICKRDELSED